MRGTVGHYTLFDTVFLLFTMFLHFKFITKFIYIILGCLALGLYATISYLKLLLNKVADFYWTSIYFGRFHNLKWASDNTLITLYGLKLHNVIFGWEEEFLVVNSDLECEGIETIYHPNIVMRIWQDALSQLKYRTPFRHWHACRKTPLRRALSLASIILKRLVGFWTLGVFIFIYYELRLLLPLYLLKFLNRLTRIRSMYPFNLFIYLTVASCFLLAAAFPDSGYLAYGEESLFASFLCFTAPVVPAASFASQGHKFNKKAVHSFTFSEVEGDKKLEAIIRQFFDKDLKLGFKYFLVLKVKTVKADGRVSFHNSIIKNKEGLTEYLNFINWQLSLKSEIYSDEKNLLALAFESVSIPNRKVKPAGKAVRLNIQEINEIIRSARRRIDAIKNPSATLPLPRPMTVSDSE